MKTKGTPRVISEEAVEAAWWAMPKDSYVDSKEHVRAILEAAAPHMLAGSELKLSSHRCESWQLQMKADGGEYCAACGKTQP